MSKMYFTEYGNLEWLNPNEYYATAWKYLCTAQGVDGEYYDIIILGDYPCSIRYTHI